MPLIQSKSKKAFEKNVKTEMDAHPEADKRAQNLAIAYSIKRKNAKKKMASGGAVENDFKSEGMANADSASTPEDMAMLNKRKMMASGGPVDLSAANESRPMPDGTYASTAEERRNSMRKKLEKPDWTDNTWDEQAGRSQSRAPGEAAQSNFHTDKMTTVDDASTDTNMDMEMEDATDRDAVNRHHSEDISDALLMADGGNVSLEQSTMDDTDSIADAIIAKLREAKLIKSYADGGMVDLEDNARESNNVEDQLSYNALRKENYSESAALDTEQPEDSNETGDSRETDSENVHDRPIVEEIMRRKKRNRM